MKKLLTFLGCIFCIICYSQTLKVDLARNQNSTTTQTIEFQILSKIIIQHIVVRPDVHYSVEVKKEHKRQGPLTLPTGSTTALAGGPDVCSGLNAAITVLKEEQKETQIAEDSNELENEIKRADKKCEDVIGEARKLINATSPSLDLKPINIGNGDIVTITITRDDKDKSKWVYIFETESINHWTTYFGFTYSPNILTHFSNYYAEQRDTGNSYLVTKMNGSTKNVFQNLSPTAMFTYTWQKKQDAPLRFGLTGGFMYNTDVFGAMFGPSLVIGDNLTINTGISFLQKYKLKGQYKTDGTQVVKDNLSFDQLHDKIWTYDMFFSIGLNIPELFKKKTTSNTTDNSTSGKSDNGASGNSTDSKSGNSTGGNKSDSSGNKSDSTNSKKRPNGAVGMSNNGIIGKSAIRTLFKSDKNDDKSHNGTSDRAFMVQDRKRSLFLYQIRREPTVQVNFLYIPNIPGSIRSSYSG